MAKRSRFSEYQNSYANYNFELTDDALADIAGDREIKVLIHTGTGENYKAIAQAG